MLKKVNQIRRNFSKGSADKKSDGDSSTKKKSNQKKVNRETQTDTAQQKNVSKKLDFDRPTNRGRHSRARHSLKPLIWRLNWYLLSN